MPTIVAPDEDESQPFTLSRAAGKFRRGARGTGFFIGMKTYAEKRKDPRWQKMRLRIFERDEFCCTACGSSDRNIQVHHLYYTPRTEPWDYPESDLITLCDDCHNEMTFRLPSVLRYLRTPEQMACWQYMMQLCEEKQAFGLAMDVAYSVDTLHRAVSDDDVLAAKVMIADCAATLETIAQ